jgi:hypothetical protein
LHIIFFNQIIFDLPQLFQLTSRRPTLRAPEMGRIEFSSDAILSRGRDDRSVAHPGEYSLGVVSAVGTPS